eukprot:m.682053 g.682053  ORF g.682053 m.682053 type:complete len:234 (+) comp22816_c0_seq4:1299-2000(+)
MMATDPTTGVAQGATPPPSAPSPAATTEGVASVRRASGGEHTLGMVCVDKCGGPSATGGSAVTTVNTAGVHTRFLSPSLEADFARLCKESLGSTQGSLRQRNLPASFFTFPHVQPNGSAGSCPGPAVEPKASTSTPRVHAVKAVGSRVGASGPTRKQTAKGVSLQKSVFMPIAHCSPIKKDRKRTPSPGGKSLRGVVAGRLSSCNPLLLPLSLPCMPCGVTVHAWAESDGPGG